MARLDALREPFPAGPSDPADVLVLLDEFGSPATMAMAGPRFFGLVIGGSLPVAVAANWLANPGAGAATPRVQAEGTCWCGGTLWQGRTAMRISVSSWATTEEDVERSLAAMLRVAQS